MSYIHLWQVQSNRRVWTHVTAKILGRRNKLQFFCFPLFIYYYSNTTPWMLVIKQWNIFLYPSFNDYKCTLSKQMSYPIISVHNGYGYFSSIISSNLGLPNKGSKDNQYSKISYFVKSVDNSKTDTVGNIYLQLISHKSEFKSVNSPYIRFN